MAVVWIQTNAIKTLTIKFTYLAQDVIILVKSINLFCVNFLFLSVNAIYQFYVVDDNVYAAHQLRDFHIAVGNSIDSCYSFNPENFTHCVHVPGRQLDLDAQPFPCDEPIKGRYVVVYLETYRHTALTLCEVQVQGTPVTGNRRVCQNNFCSSIHQ